MARWSMIRGPVLPQSRDRLWAIVSRRLELVESGLSLVAEGLDCSDGQHGPIDGLARDGAGAPVLVVLALDGDALLMPRLLSAVAFLERVGETLGQAVPEASFCSGAAARILVIGTDASAHSLADLERLHMPQLEISLLEPFRLAGTERFAVRRLGAIASAPVAAPAAAGFGGAALDAGQDAAWLSIQNLCERLDPAVRIDGDRFRRRISYCGRVLGHVALRDGALRATSDEYECVLATKADVRSFGDRLVRRYAECAGVGGLRAEPMRDTAPAVAARDSLRSTMSSALSAEEYAALSEPGSAVLRDSSG